MATGQIVTTQGKLIAFNRLWKAVPDYTTPTLFKVGTGTNTPAIGNTDLQTPVDITAGVQTKAFASGYPTLDETNLQSLIRSILLTTEGNTNSITEFGIVNTDGTAKLYSRAVFTPITKTTSVQVIFVQKDKIA